MSKVNRAPLSMSKLAKFMNGKDGKIAVLVATVTDDVRLHVVPKMRVCALRFTETARARIVKVGLHTRRCRLTWVNTAPQRCTAQLRQQSGVLDWSRVDSWAELLMPAAVLRGGASTIDLLMGANEMAVAVSDARWT